MMIKRYLAKTNKEALGKVKKELGNDAVILNMRKIRKGGFLGLFKKPWVEILAAADRSIVVDDDSKDTRLENTEKKLYTIDNRINKYGGTFNNYNRNQVYEKLIQNEVENYIARSILDQAEKLDGDKLNHVRKIISSYFNYQPDFELKNKDICLFVGPTGVGKTTTLAKLAAIHSIKYQRDVALITADTYRIAAVQQLKTYADIMNVPLQVVYSSKEMKKAVDKFKDKDIIMIDTAGKNMNEQENISEINSLVEASGSNQIFLVLSCVTKFSTIKNLIQRYSFLDDYKLIFTKLDEAEKYGVILNTLYISNHPLQYVTTGQNVPDDIEIFNYEKFMDNLLR